MKKLFLRNLLLAVLLAVGGVVDVLAAGYTRTLTDGLAIAGYKAKAFYNFQTNTPEVLPTEGDLRYRDENGIWGLHNFGSGPRSATATIPVESGQILVVQHYSRDNVATINRGALNETLTASSGYEVYDITSTADDITFSIARSGGLVAALVMEEDMSAYLTATYDFEGESPAQPFTARSRITAAVETDETLGSNVLGFTCDWNAQNDYSFADFNLSSLFVKASAAIFEFDYYNTNGGRAILTIGDGDVRGTTGGSSKTTYNASGAIFRIGSEKNYAIVNGSNLVLDTYCNKWLHVKVIVKCEDKKVSYVISQGETVLRSETNIGYYDVDAVKCSQIDLFGYINNSHCAMIDNLSISYLPGNVDYTVKGVDAQGAELYTIASGSGVQNSSVTIPFSTYFNNDGKLLKADKIDDSKKQYNYTFTLDADPTEKTITYKDTDIDNVVFLTEAEDLEGVTVISTSNSAIRSSRSKSAYNGDADTKITTLEPGVYKLTSVICDFNSSNPSAEFSYYAGDTEIFKHKAASINWDEQTSEEFTITTETDIILKAGGGSKKGVDLIYIVKTGDYSGEVPVVETLDITDLYLTNPSFETGDLTGWTTTIGEDTGVKPNSNATYTTKGVDGAYLFNTWWHGYAVKQTIADLPAATYQLSALITSDGGYHSLFVNDSEDAEIGKNTIHPTNAGEFTNVSTNFTLAAAGSVTIGARGSSVEDSYDDLYWYKADNFRLTLVLGEDGLIPAAIVDKIMTANPVSEGKVSSVAAIAYTTARATFAQEPTLNSCNAFVEAVKNYNKSVADYALVDAGAIPTNTADGWVISTKNGSLACNTWSTEGNSDGSGMTTPFVQDWVGSGTPLAGGQTDGKLYYRLLLNPGETYTVTALVRVFNEAATGVTGATFFVGNDTKSIDELGAACTGDFSTKGKFGTFSCTAEVGEDGVLEFGVALDAASPINWISIKDVVIAEPSGKVPTAIALDKQSATVAVGETVTIAATITPDDADDQTVTWTSSDESVAIVSGGVVSALNAGTATITATAVAGDNVSATATITVTEAPAIANATAISGTGKYLLRNVATGKYLGQGNSYGTQASINEHAVWITATKQDDGTYKLTGICANSGLGSNGYVDNGTPAALTVAPVEGKTNVYTLSVAEGQYVSAQAGTTIVTMTSTNAHTSLAQWQFIAETDANKNLASASENNPVDVTYMISDANFSRNVDSSVWTMEAANQNLSGGDDTNRCAESYHATFTLSQVLNVPNGTYKMRAQAVANNDATGAVVYANDQETAFNVMANGENSMGACSAQFTAGNYFTEWVTVTVTDRQLTVGVKGGNGSSWCVWDNFELYLIGYTPVTDITASIDNAEFEVGQTATVTAATDPAAASFNALTYTSSNEQVATVDANGVVTGVAAGEATITIAAEMENVSKTIGVTVVTPAVMPEEIKFDKYEIALDEKTVTYQLVPQVVPAEANQAVTYVSSDEQVATVSAEGIVSAVLPGTATITVTSAAKQDVQAQVTVTVTFPEAGSPAPYYANDGATRTTYTAGENLIKNGAFEYPNGYYGWKNGAGGNMAADNFKIVTDGDNHYLQAQNSGGAGTANSIQTAWPIEAGKTYVFGYRIKANDNGNSEFHVVSLTNSIGTETQKISDNNTPIATQWTEVKYQFTNTEGYQYLQFKARWLASKQCYDDFYLAEAAYTIEGNVDYATAAIPTANIGEGAFQYSQSAVSDAEALVQGEATVEEVQAAYDALTTVNEPEDGQLFNVVLTYGGWNYDQKAMTYIAGGRNDAGLYNIQYAAAANQNLAQAFTFTKVSGNNYKMSQIDADGVARYISTGVPYGGNTAQIRTTTDESKALVVTVIPTATDGKWNLRNTEANQYIGSQDVGVYTVNSHIDFNIVETQKPSITINTTAAGWGTTILPFAVTSIPDGVKVYACAELDGAALTLQEVKALEANKPYIIEGAWNETLTGDAQGAKLSYTEGLLTGTYEQMAAPNGSYILQNQNGKVGFFKVDTEVAQPNVPANRAYLTVPAEAGTRAFLLDDSQVITAIGAIEALTSGQAEIFNGNGVKQPKLSKGLNIIRMSNGKTQKVMVK